MMNTINLHYCNRRVLIVCHQVVVLCMRYILEELDEPAILAIDKQGDVLNCGISHLRLRSRSQGHLRAQADVVESRRSAGSGGRAQDVREGRHGRLAMSGPDRSTSRAHEHPLPPVVDGDKDSKGRILVIAGSRDVPGAALLTATAAMRAGAGKLTIATVESVAPHIAVAMPEAMVIALHEDGDGGIAGRRRTHCRGGGRSRRGRRGSGHGA